MRIVLGLYFFFVLSDIVMFAWFTYRKRAFSWLFGLRAVLTSFNPKQWIIFNLSDYL